jgi:hypothetical protein
MTFIHPLLLGGLALVGIPVVLHLIMRQQPKRLIFPAFRFLQLRQKTNQRKLRIRHIVLLVLRMLLIAVMCLALARPKLFSDRFGFLGDERAAIVVLVIDTSPSMDYTSGGETRLAEAKTRAGELLDEIGESSRVAVLDTGDPIPEWAMSRSSAQERIDNLVIRPGNRPIADALDVAFRMFTSDGFQEPGDETKPRFVYVFSDRTPASWDGNRVGDLKARRDRLPDPKPRLVYVDVGVEQPSDLAVAEIEVKPQAVSANRPVVLRVTVQATGPGGEADVSCRFDGDAQAERRPVRLRAGERQVVSFERRGLKPGYHQAEVTLQPDDSLKADNVRYATVLVREPRKLLLLCDDPRDAALWKTAIDKQQMYECDVRSVNEMKVATELTPADLANYRAVCLLDVAEPTVGLWERLDTYVRAGGGLVIAPGRRELNKDRYAEPAARRVLPAEFEQFVVSAEGVAPTDYQYKHRLLAPFREWSAQPNAAAYLGSRRAFEYWTVMPAEGAVVLLRFADADKHPALVERAQTGGGKVLVFTTPMDGRQDAAGHGSNNFNVEWFQYVLVNECVKYVAGEAEDAVLNFVAGPVVTLPLPPGARLPAYSVAGPGLTGADSQAQREETAGELRLSQVRQPGNYVVRGGGRQWESRFSVNVPQDEWLLTPPVGTEVIDELFGEDSVVRAGQNRSLKEALKDQFRQPVELFPWLMVLLLLVLVIENFLSNRFYKQPAAVV